MISLTVDPGLLLFFAGGGEGKAVRGVEVQLHHQKRAAAAHAGRGGATIAARHRLGEVETQSIPCHNT